MKKSCLRLLRQVLCMMLGIQYKKIMSGLTAFVIMFSSVPGLAESCEIELTTDEVSAEEKVTVERVMQDMALLYEEYAPKVVKYENLDFLLTLDTRFKFLYPAYLLLNDDYDNIELLSELIDKDIVTEEELFDYWDIAADVRTIPFFNSMKDLEEEDKLDIGLLIRDENRREDFKQDMDCIIGFEINFKKNRKEATQYLRSFMEKIEEATNKLNDDKSNIRYLYFLIKYVEISIQSNTMTSYDFVPLVVRGSNMSNLMPVNGVPFDWHEENDNRAILGANNALYKIDKKISKRLKYYEDAELRRNIKSAIKSIK